jgi:hypothetical protein
LKAAHNDRRAVGAVFGVGLASIGILPTSATVYGALRPFPEIEGSPCSSLVYVVS